MSLDLYQAPATVYRPQGIEMTEGEITPDPRFIDRRLLRSICDTLGAFRDLSITMPVGEVYMFLIVALNEGLSLSELAEKADMKTSTASRHLLNLSVKTHTGTKGGYGLVSREQDPAELRRNMYSLTPKGRALVRQLVSPSSKGN